MATSSASAYLALPRAEAYGASKAALSYFLESLRLDLAHQGIDVSVIHPGFVKTPLTERNDFPMPMAVTPEQAATAVTALSAPVVVGQFEIPQAVTAAAFAAADVAATANCRASGDPSAQSSGAQINGAMPASNPLDLSPLGEAGAAHTAWAGARLDASAAQSEVGWGR